MQIREPLFTVSHISIILLMQALLKDPVYNLGHKEEKESRNSQQT